VARGLLTKDQKARWIGQLAAALDFAHSEGIIHRDIKPANVMINESGDALLMDFGLAREIEGSSSLTGSMLMGTPAFISPEQARGEKIDSRSDQYSLGIILYKIATGRLPFHSENPMAVVMQHLHEPVPRPGRFNRDLSESEEKVIVKSLAKRPEERFPSLAVLNKAYQAALAGKRLPEFDLPPPGATVTTMRRETPAISQAVGSAPALPRRRSTWWIVPVILLAVMGAAALAYPSLSALFGIGTPVSNPPPEPTPAATSFVPIVGDPTKQPEESPVAATPTPITSNDCPGLTLHPPLVRDNTVMFLIYNATENPVKIRDLKDVAWPGLSNGYLHEITFGGEVIWQGETTSEDLNRIGLDLTLAPNRSTPLELKFQWPASNAGYILSLALDVGCILGGNW
jgi:serine/threonine protein kinase